MLIDLVEVDTLRDVTTGPDADDDLGVFISDDLADRWGVTRTYIHELRADGSAPLDPPLADGRVIGRSRGQGTMVWTLAQVLAFETAHPAWVAATAERQARQAARRAARAQDPAAEN